MCGILGSLNFKTDKSSFENALKTLEFRGPDENGYYSDKEVYLGNTRLSIIDLFGGHQPISNEADSVVTVFNGEIYNYLNLRSNLEGKGHVFKTHTDTEVLVHLYEEYGNQMSEHLDGMFAFAVWDKVRKKLLLSRGPFGQKPLVYYFKDNILVFASEAKALLSFGHVKQNIRVNRKSLIKYLYYGYVPSPNSIYENINKLKPATLLEFSFDGSEIRMQEYCYWDPQSKVNAWPLGSSELLDQMDELVRRAVEKRLMADVAVGAFLSGGIDSGLVAANIVKLNPNIETFTIGYEEADFDESALAASTAKHLRVRNHQLKLTEKEVLDSIGSILSYVDEPMADTSIIPSYFISKLAREKVKVALSGDGGDELFGGYLKYSAHWAANLVSPFAKVPFFSNSLCSFMNVFSKSASGKEANKMFVDSLKLPMEIRNFLWTGGCFCPAELGGLVKGGVTDSLEEVFEDSFYYGGLFNGRDHCVQKALYLDSRIQLPDGYLLKTDWASMANSLEVRNPLLDKSLAEFAFSLPFNYKVRLLKKKLMLKKLAARYLPTKVINGKKRGFGIPVGRWMRNGMRDFVGDHLSGSRLGDHFVEEEVSRIYKEHINGADNTQRLWRLVILSKVLNSSGVS